MTAVSIPVGYGRRVMPLSEADRRYGDKMHPEFRRRLFAFLASRGGMLGIGSAWRRTPHPVSAASRAGHSFHQDQRFTNGPTACAAVDLVARNGSNVHRAPLPHEVPWQDGDHPDRTRFGVHVNIRSEVWHLQPIELDGWRSWARAGRPNLETHRIAVIDAPAPVPDLTGHPPFDPERCLWGLWPVAEKSTTRRGHHGDVVAYLQGVLHAVGENPGPIDGWFGRQTLAAVIELQRFHDLTRDGVVGPITWPYVDTAATRHSGAS